MRGSHQQRDARRCERPIAPHLWDQSSTGTFCSTDGELGRSSDRRRLRRRGQVEWKLTASRESHRRMNGRLTTKRIPLLELQRSLLLLIVISNNANARSSPSSQGLATADSGNFILSFLPSHVRFPPGKGISPMSALSSGHLGILFDHPRVEGET